MRSTTTGKATAEGLHQKKGPSKNLSKKGSSKKLPKKGPTQQIPATTEGLYEDKFFRRRRLTQYSRKERSEQNLVHRLALQYGDPDEVVVGFGDWTDTQFRRRRGKASTVKGATLRNLLRKFGFKVFLVDEFMTSKCCSACAAENQEGICSNPDFVKVIDPLWKKKLQKEEKKLKKEIMEHNQLDNVVKRNFEDEWTKQLPFMKARLQSNKVSPWGLVQCAKCHVLWNRDFNSAINIYNIVNGIIQGQGRPAVLERPKSQTITIEDGGITDQVPKKKSVSKCQFCHMEGHTTAKCPQRPVPPKSPRTCTICRQPGHDRNNCPSKAQKDVPKDSQVENEEPES
ncbi:hypothetical protein GEMRC1_010092 [Eukaryota sp. GEM-RC1]